MTKYKVRYETYRNCRIGRSSWEEEEFTDHGEAVNFRDKMSRKYGLATHLDIIQDPQPYDPYAEKAQRAVTYWASKWNGF